MNQIVVAKEVVYAYNTSAAAITSVNAINDLDTGSIAIFTEAGALVTAANMGTVLDDVKRCYIAVGNQATVTGGAKSMITVPFPRIGFNVSYRKDAYVAPVKLRKFIGSDGTTAGTALNMPTYANGNIVQLRIINTTPGLRTMASVEGTEVYRYEYTGIPGDTNNTMITKLIANKINADSDRIVNATVVGSQTGIQLDAIDFGTTFSITLDESLQGATVEQPEGTIVGVSVAINYGLGTSDAVLALEDAYSPERGNTAKYANLPTKYYSNPSLVVAGETYNLYTIQWDDARSMPLGAQQTSRFSIVVAIPNGTALTTSFETIMAEMFAGTIATSPAETGA